ncbi:MAG: hypothetical protein H8E44_32175 [Planctomycetes bacterium]|nr:hypothetical protein [Planctomycetota bacterium]MBL7042115.1 hypothetical protein [Pirellulaceae bacterium]
MQMMPSRPDKRENRSLPLTFLVTLVILAIAGCGDSGNGTPTAKSPSPRKNTQAKVEASGKSNLPTVRPGQFEPKAITTSKLPTPKLDERRSLADLANQDDGGDGGAAAKKPIVLTVTPRGKRLPIDDTKAAVAGIRKLIGKHLTLYTDVPPSPEVDELPAAFDAAVPLWCKYFEVDPMNAMDWHMTGFVIQEKARFQGAGMLPDDLPPFINGFQRGRYVWLYGQPTAYYRRHLLLHEGTHAFMDLIVGGLGPPWYAEGMAELLGTHQWQDGELTLAYMPRQKTETPGWGRIKIVKDELAAGNGMMPANILEYGPQAHLRNEPYGWCWALAAFFDSDPRTQKAFRELRKKIRTEDITQWFRQQVQDDWADLSEDWQVFVMNIDYGYDIARSVIVRKTAQAVPASGATATISADRGWQSTGILLTAGTTYRIDATGQYQVAETSEIWWCEPGGVTIHYFQGRPLGLLLGAVRDHSQPLEGMSPLVKPRPIGLGTTLEPEVSGTLYLKINESPAELGDNQGQITVRVQVQ